MSSTPYFFAHRIGNLKGTGETVYSFQDSYIVKRLIDGRERAVTVPEKEIESYDDEEGEDPETTYYRNAATCQERD